MNYAHGLGSFNPADNIANGTDWVLKSLLDLSPSEYELCVEDCLTLDSYASDAQLFQIVLWNEKDFHELINKYVQAFIAKDFDVLSSRSPDLDLNRCLLNLLSSIRSYLDYVELKLKRKHGPKSANALRFKRDCAEAYDNSFSYRFLYRFRNYAQHCGLPLTKISFERRPVDSESSLGDSSLDIGVYRDELLQADFQWGTLREGIAAQPERINIPNHVVAMMEQLKQIHSNYVADQFVTLRPNAMRLRDLIQKIPCEFEELLLFKFSIDPTDVTRKVNLRTQLLPLKIVEDVFDARFAILFEEDPQ